jgi:hypothetical protein
MRYIYAALDFAPGDEVEIFGLKSSPELNGKRGTVRPRDAWRSDRIAVLLNDSKPPQSVAVKPTNMKLVPACRICYGDDVDELLLLSGCGCRGSSGHLHATCAVQAAASNPRLRQICAMCKVPYSGALKLALAEDWCRRTAHLDAAADMERFAARTMLSNALSALGKNAEAEEVVRGLIAAATARHGAEHPHAMGTSMNLAVLLSNQGKLDEAEAICTPLLATQARVLGAEHRDTLGTAMQLAGTALAQGKNALAEERFHTCHAQLVRALGTPCESRARTRLPPHAQPADQETESAHLAAGETHPNTMVAAMNLGSALLAQATAWHSAA